MIQIHSVSDAISISSYTFSIFSVYMAVMHYQFDYLIGLFLVLQIERFIKNKTKNINITILKRPHNASNCNGKNDDGNVGNDPGFPSGHMSATSFMTNLYYLKQCKTKNISNYILYNSWNIFMGYARYSKNCHNIVQIIGGYLLGLMVAFVFYLVP